MKKLLMFAFVAVLMSCLLLAACGTPAPETPATPAPETPTAPEPEKEQKPELVATVDNPLELNFSYHAPPIASLVRAMLKPWADELEEKCGGRVKIIHHAGSSLLGADDVFDGILAGVCDMGHVSCSSYPGRFPLSDVSDLPLIYPNTEVAGVANHEWLLNWAMDGELKDAKLMITIPMTAQQYFGNKEVKVLEDMHGLKLRGAGKSDTAVYEQLGATGVSIPTGDVFSALDTGMVDGTVFSWSGALAFGFNTATKYRTECSLYLPVHQLLLSRQVYERLPDDLKKIFDEMSTPEISKKYGAANMAEEGVGRRSMERYDERAGNPPIYVLPPEEAQRWREATAPLVDKWIAALDKEGFPGQAVFDDLVSIVEKHSQ